MDKAYYSLDTYLKETYGEKCYKIAIDAGLTCPNRDGTAGTFGCTFCSAGGSGDFAVSGKNRSIQAQIADGLLLFGRKQVGQKYIAYFQAFTNTYGEPAYLEKIYREALSHASVIGISIATRPDCLPPSVLNILQKLKAEYAPKFIWIELGLQTCHESTAGFINRGYALPVFKHAVETLKRLSIPAIVHVILGLPGETAEMMYGTVRFLNTLRPFGVKLQLLHVLRHTRLAAQYGLEKPETGGCVLSGERPYKEKGQDFFPVSGTSCPILHIFSLEEYVDVLIHCLELLPPDTVIHRVTGDGPKELLLAPLWSLNKRNVLNTLHRTMKLRETYQGRLYHDARSIDSV